MAGVILRRGCSSLKKNPRETASVRCALGNDVLEFIPSHPLFLQKFEDDITYWLNRGRNGHDYYDYHQRHYDEDAAIGSRSPHGFRHGASVNYDDY